MIILDDDVPTKRNLELFNAVHSAIKRSQNLPTIMQLRILQATVEKLALSIEELKAGHKIRNEELDLASLINLSEIPADYLKIPDIEEE